MRHARVSLMRVNVVVALTFSAIVGGLVAGMSLGIRLLHLKAV
ncbi:histidine permease YuiF [Vibrio sp. JCM 19052]|nr:histidine permease YuiF [Vibrio sp. JCM 19052]